MIIEWKWVIALSLCLSPFRYAWNCTR